MSRKKLPYPNTKYHHENTSVYLGWDGRGCKGYGFSDPLKSIVHTLI